MSLFPNTINYVKFLNIATLACVSDPTAVVCSLLVNETRFTGNVEKKNPN